MSITTKNTRSPNSDLPLRVVKPLTVESPSERTIRIEAAHKILQRFVTPPIMLPTLHDATPCVLKPTIPLKRGLRLFDGSHGIGHFGVINRDDSPEQLASQQIVCHEKTKLSVDKVTTFYRNDTSEFLGELQEAERLLYQKLNAISKIDFPAQKRKLLAQETVESGPETLAKLLSDSETKIVPEPKSKAKPAETKPVIEIETFVASFSKVTKPDYLKKSKKRHLHEYNLQYEHLLDEIHPKNVTKCSIVKDSKPFEYSENEDVQVATTLPEYGAMIVGETYTLDVIKFEHHTLCVDDNDVIKCRQPEIDVQQERGDNIVAIAKADDIRDMVSHAVVMPSDQIVLTKTVIEKQQTPAETGHVSTGANTEIGVDTKETEVVVEVTDCKTKYKTANVVRNEKAEQNAIISQNTASSTVSNATSNTASNTTSNQPHTIVEVDRAVKVNRTVEVNHTAVTNHSVVTNHDVVINHVVEARHTHVTNPAVEVNHDVTANHSVVINRDVVINRVVETDCADETNDTTCRKNIINKEVANTDSVQKISRATMSDRIINITQNTNLKETCDSKTRYNEMSHGISADELPKSPTRTQASSLVSGDEALLVGNEHVSSSDEWHEEVAVEVNKTSSARTTNSVSVSNVGTLAVENEPVAKPTFPTIIRRLEELASEQYDLLAEHIKNKVYDGSRLIAFCGVQRRVGCSTMVLAAAKGMAQRGLKTIVVDVNFEFPMLRALLTSTPNTNVSHESENDDYSHDCLESKQTLAFGCDKASRAVGVDDLETETYDRHEQKMCWVDVLLEKNSWESIGISPEGQHLLTVLPLSENALTSWTHVEPEVLQQKTNRLISNLHEHFDLVLLDCGSFDPEFEEITWGELELFQPDGVVLVRNPNTTTLEKMEPFRRDLRANGIEEFGVAENFT